MPLGGQDAHRTVGGTPSLQTSRFGFEDGRAPDAAVSNRLDEGVFVKTMLHKNRLRSRCPCQAFGLVWSSEAVSPVPDGANVKRALTAKCPPDKGLGGRLNWGAQRFPVIRFAALLRWQQGS